MGLSSVKMVKIVLLSTAFCLSLSASGVAEPADEILQQWMRHFPDPYSSHDRTDDMAVVGSQNIYLTGTTGRGYRWGMITLTKFKPELSDTEYEFRGGSPPDFTLQQNFPNPFNPTTTIQYSLHRDSRVSLAIYDLRGELVVTLVSGYQEAGRYSVEWNGKDDSGRDVGTGVYFCRLLAGEFVKARRMVLIK